MIFARTVAGESVVLYAAMKMQQAIKCSVIGWIAGSLAFAVVAFGIIPTVLGSVLPPLDGVRLAVLSLIWLVATPFGLLGGWLGGRLPLEGGRTTQHVMAGLLGIIFCVPVSCIGLWYAGW